MGSVGSVASAFCAGSWMSFGSVASYQSNRSLLSHQSGGSVLSSQSQGGLRTRRSHGDAGPVVRPLTALAVVGVSALAWWLVLRGSGRRQ